VGEVEWQTLLAQQEAGKVIEDTIRKAGGLDASRGFPKIIKS
jgi:hypothetical protein